VESWKPKSPRPAKSDDRGYIDNENKVLAASQPLRCFSQDALVIGWMQLRYEVEEQRTGRASRPSSSGRPYPPV